MKFIKKNQVVVAVIGLMFIAAGYLSFSNTKANNLNQVIETGTLLDSEQMAAIGDAQLVSSQPANDSNLMNNENDTIRDEVQGNKTENTNDNSQAEGKNNIETNTQVTTDEYFTKSRLERDTMYSQMIDSYQKILDKTNASESQKSTAQKEIKRINEQKNAIMITENLIKNKGFEDLIIFINDKSINIIVKSKELKSEQIAQIQNIITRELKADISDIHISNKE